MGKVIGVDGKVYSTVSAAEAAGTTASPSALSIGTTIRTKATLVLSSLSNLFTS
ncbi:MAG: hypothetical protein II886_12975 [Prevotella sp.]|nr:hypothetical protein [Prevotella sp.]